MAERHKQDDDKSNKKNKRIKRTRTVITKPEAKANKNKALPKVNIPPLHRWKVLRKR